MREDSERRCVFCGEVVLPSEDHYCHDMAEYMDTLQYRWADRWCRSPLIPSVNHQVQHFMQQSCNSRATLLEHRHR
jgi:hypothetical protein